MGSLSVKAFVVLGAMIGVIGCGEDGNAESIRAKGAQRQKSSQDMLDYAYRFLEKDFPKECASEKLFYVPDGVDDGLKVVRANLKKMPDMFAFSYTLGELTPTSIAYGYCPPNEGDNRGKIYFCDSDDGTDKISHVGDGWVIAESLRQRDYCGFIYTDEDDMYVEGQKLKGGFYVLVGRQKVPLANGSSLSMYAFVKLSPESNRVALEAYKYNAKAVSATIDENDDRRKKRDRAEKERKEKEREAVEAEYHKELGKCFSDFVFRDLKSQFHLPDELSNVINDIEFIDPGSFRCSKDDRELRTGIETNFENAIKSQDWKYVIDCVQIDIAANDDPAQCASNALQRAYEFTRYFKVRNDFKMSNKEYREYQEKLKKYRYYIVDLHSNTIHPETLKIGYRVQLPIDADLYCVKRADYERFEKFISEGDVKGFIRALDERESNKFNGAFEKVFSNFAFRKVEAQFHFPEDAQGISIKVWKEGAVMYGKYYSDDTPIIDKMLDNHDWSRFATSLGVLVSADSNPEQLAKDTYARIPSCWRMICLKPRGYEPPRYNRATGKKSRGRKDFSFFIVDKNAAEQVKFIVAEDHVWGDYRDFLQFAIGAELYCLPNEDKAIFDNVHDAKAFEDLWNKKYGKSAAE